MADCYSGVWPHYSLTSHSPIGGHLGCCQVFVYWVTLFSALPKMVHNLYHSRCIREKLIAAYDGYLRTLELNSLGDPELRLAARSI